MKEIYMGDGIYIGELEDKTPEMIYTSNGYVKTNTIYLTYETSIAIRDYLNRMYPKI